MALPSNPNVTVSGSASSGSAPVDNPLVSGVYDGSFERYALGDSAGRQQVAGAAADGATAAGNPVMVGGSDGTNSRVARINTGNELHVTGEGLKAAYRANSLALAVAASPTDIFTLFGSASKTIRVRRIVVSMTTATAAQYVDFNLVKRSTADSAGTSSAATAIPLDSNDSAATGTVLQYTANPTLGTAVGVVASQRYFSGLTGTAALMPPPVEFSFADRGARALVLRGTTQGLCLNVNGGGANASTADIYIEWTEE